MSLESQPPHSGDANAENAFVQQALAAADKSERNSRIIVALLVALCLVVFIWMHMHMFPPESLSGLLHTMLRVDLFFMVLLFAITMYLRQVMNRNTRTILRALANTRLR
jgi:lipopolysaccharide export LptBFGC system permease protein LptF